jgi:hypothetical protein
VKITREDERLSIQVSNQPRFKIFPRTQTEFFPKFVQADITLTKDQERQSHKSEPEGVRPDLDGAEGEVAGQGAA